MGLLSLSPGNKLHLNRVSTMNKALEYMALAKPVVAFDLPETRVSCGEAALYASEATPEALAREMVKLVDDFEPDYDPAVWAAFGGTVLAGVYSFIRSRYGLAAAYLCQVTVNLMLLFVPSLLAG